MPVEYLESLLHCWRVSLPLRGAPEVGIDALGVDSRPLNGGKGGDVSQEGRKKKDLLCVGV